jgi:hypothetical protein
VYDFAMQNGKLFYTKDNKKTEIPLNTSTWEIIPESTMAPTLGF